MKKKTKKKFWIAARLGLVALFFGTLVVMDMVQPKKQVEKVQALKDHLKEQTKTTWTQTWREAKDAQRDLEIEARQFQKELGRDADDLEKKARENALNLRREVENLDVAIPSLPRLSASLPPLPPLPRMISRDLPNLEDLSHEHLPFEESVFKEGPIRETLPPPQKEKATPKPTPRPSPTAFSENALESLDLPETPRGKIAIVLDDIGLNTTLSSRAIALPESVTLSFLPYAPKLADQVAHAKNAGHPVMLHLPMEPKSTLSAGPKALLSGLGDAEFQTRLAAALNSFQGYDGVNNHMGSKLTTLPHEMAVVMKALKTRNLFFLDSRTTPVTIAEKTGRELGLKTAARDVFLDDDPAIDSIMAQLSQLEGLAQRHGQAIAIGHPHTTTLTALENWMPKARQAGYDFVPVKDLVE